MAESPEIERYRQAWRDRRRRWTALIAMLIGFMVLLSLWPQPVAVALWFVTTMAVAWYLVSFRCPRCGETFMSVPDATGPSWPHYGCSGCRLRADTMPD